MTLHRRFVPTVATAGAILALAATPAPARIDTRLGTYPASAAKPSAQVDRHFPALNDPGVTSRAVADGPVVIRTVEPSGFDWGAAGAGAGVGIALLLVGGAAYTRLHRRRVHVVA